MAGTGSNDRSDAGPGGDTPVTVLVVDDQESFRRVMRDLVATTEGFTLVGEADSGEGALEAVAKLSPRLVLMDKRMPGIGGIEATRLLADRHPEVVVVLVSVEQPDTQLRRSCRAAAFVRKQDLSTSVLREVWRDHGA